MVKALRERTGAGMMECKKALTDTGGDMEAAVEELRKKGAAKADKKSGRIAAEGTVRATLSEDCRTGVLVEVNCETDFVAKDENFRKFSADVAATVLEQRPEDVSKLAGLKISGSDVTVDEARVELFSKIGENIAVRRFAVVEAQDDQSVSVYSHGTRIGVLVRSRGGRSDIGKDVAMHIAAMRPACVSKENVPQDQLDKEKDIFIAQAADSGKPQNIVEKIVEGRLQKYVNEITLLGQPFVKDADMSVQKLLEGEGAEVQEFVRFEVGEGIERKEDDFVAEVMAQAKGA
jgi:elongation factor Ts